MRKEDWLVGSGLNTRKNLEIGNFLQIQLRLPKEVGEQSESRPLLQEKIVAKRKDLATIFVT